MFKNLIRLRLLDFFELTAATAGALYIYQSSGWWDWEKSWVISALAISAVVFWIATRLGKTTPTPGLFLATYAGALYGLSDLSPWMAIFGRLAVIETALSLFPTSTPAGDPQERCLTVAVVAVLMTIPALFWGCTWLAAGNLIQITRKKFEFPKDNLSKAFLVSQTIVALIFVGGLAYYSLRPQVRYVRTIRLPFDYATVEAPDPQHSPYEEAPTICAWTAATDNSHIYALFSNRKLLEVEITSSLSTREIPIQCEPLTHDRSKRTRGIQIAYNGDFGSIPPIAYDRFPTDYSLWTLSSDKLLLEEVGIKGIRGEFTILELADPKNSTQPPYSRDSESPEHAFQPPIVAISNDGNWVVTEGINSRDVPAEEHLHVVHSLWHTVSMKCVRTQDEPASYRNDYDIGVTNSGEITRHKRPDFQTPAATIAPDCRFTSLTSWRIRRTNEHPRVHQQTDDGAYVLDHDGLFKIPNEKDLLKNYTMRNCTAVLDTKTGRVLLSGNRLDPGTSKYDSKSRRLMRLLDGEVNLTEEDPTKPRIRILEHLLHDAHSGQLTLIDPVQGDLSTSWLRANQLKKINIVAAKFTPDGRYFIIQDEDESADLFHVFAMP